MKRRSNSRYTEHGFTLTEMLIATAIILVGLVAVAQLVPASVMLNSNNRSNATALVLAQRQLEAMREVSLNTTTFNDPLGVLCPLSTTCYLGDPTQPPKAGGEVTVSIRPECWVLGRETRAQNCVEGVIGGAVYLGEMAQYDFVCAAVTLKIVELNPRFVGQTVQGALQACVEPEDVVVLVE